MFNIATYNKLIVAGSSRDSVSVPANFTLMRFNSDINSNIIENTVSDNLLMVYPNPASDIINLNLKLNKSVEIKIFDVVGKLIKKESINYKNEIDVSELNPGIYFVKVTIDKQEFVSKFAKQ